MTDGTPSRRSPPRPFLLEDPAWAERRLRIRRRVRRSVLGLVVASALAAGVGYGMRVRMRRAVVVEVVTRDFDRLERAQAEFFAERGRYATLADLGTAYVASQGVRIWVDRADSRGWVARALHVRSSLVCRTTGGGGGAPVVDCRS